MNGADHDSDNQLPPALEHALGHAASLPQIFQTEPDVWQIKWCQTKRQLGVLFDDATRDKTREVRAVTESISRVHFRDEVNVELGDVLVLVETIQEPGKQFISPTALIGFSPNENHITTPALKATLNWGDYQDTQLIVDDMAAFKPIPSAIFENSEICLAFELSTIN